MRKRLLIGAGVALDFGAAAVFVSPWTPELIENTVAEAPVPVRDLDVTKRHRFVKLDQGLLEDLVRDTEVLTVELFPGETVTIRSNDR